MIVFCIFLSVINFYFIVKILSEKPYQKDIQDFQTQTERLMVEFNRITTRNVDLLDSRIEELNHKIRQSQKTEATLKELFEEAQKIEHLSSIIPTLSIEHPQNTNISEIIDNATNIIDEHNGQSPTSDTSNDTVVSNEEPNNTINEYLNDNPSFEELISLNSHSTDGQSTVYTETLLDSLTPPNNIIEVKEIENQQSWADGQSSVSIETPLDSLTLPNNIVEVKENESQRSWSPDGQSTDSLFEGVSVNKIKKHRKKTKNSQELLKKHIQENKTKEELLEMGYNINEINLVSLLEKNSN